MKDVTIMLHDIYLQFSIKVVINMLLNGVCWIMWAEFFDWKTELERATTSYVKRRKERRFGSVIRRQYYCHRSGITHTRSRGIRHGKIQGSCRIGSTCPSAIFAHVTKSGL